MNYWYRDSYVMHFGQKNEALCQENIKESRYFLELQNMLGDYGIPQGVTLHQTHGTHGLCIDQMLQPGQSSFFQHSGDFLITNQKNIALIILTADCIPLVMYDPTRQAIALIHAGWKGAYQGVLQQALLMMQQKYNTKTADLICTFGPSARSCCYEVSPDFVENFNTKYGNLIGFVRRNASWYFDNSLFLQQILKKSGIMADNIYVSSACCTICNDHFCSFRREKDLAGRQVTMVALR